MSIVSVLSKSFFCCSFSFSNNQLSSLPDELGNLAKLRELMISLNRYVDLHAVLEGLVLEFASFDLCMYSNVTEWIVY
jgi:Leucine-rich repeat (LRR) protein